MHITRLNTFDEVAGRYGKTKPLVSKQHSLQDDVRPIGERRRKWERIVKLDDNTYGMSCGGTGDPIFNWGYSEELKKFPLTREEIARFLPIVWRKHEDGSETVTIRNGFGDWSHNSIYSFLNRALPYGAAFRAGNRDGKQYILCASGDIYLPKTKSVPRHIYEYYKERKSAAWAAQRIKDMTPHDDSLSITLKRVDNKFYLVGEPPKEYVNRTRVDRNNKAAMKPHIEQLWSWAVTMHPLMKGNLGWNFRAELSKQLNELAKANSIKGYDINYNYPLQSCTPALLREIIADPEHVLRYGLGVAAIIELDDASDRFARGERNARWPHDPAMDDDYYKRQRKYVRAAFNNWVNRVAGFTSLIKEEK